MDENWIALTLVGELQLSLLCDALFWLPSPPQDLLPAAEVVISELALQG